MSRRHYEEFTDLTPEEALAYCKGSERQRVRSVIESIVRDGTVIDIGCGNGIESVHYTPDQYWGVDISEPLIKAARELHPDHSFDLVDATNLLFERKSFDFAIVKSMLEHVPNVEIAKQILREACRVAQTVPVAWHTPPFPDRERSQTIELKGHFGKTIN
jgi:ubiquinone/menaquinone biosynthesis C-methylase UbiE